MKKLVFLFLCISGLLNAQDARYKIEFISTWSSTTHPTDFPSSNAHWSSLVGTTHKNIAAFLELGVTATNGIEQVAETGGTSIITNEINTLIAANNAYQLIKGSGLGTGPGTITIDNVNVDANFPNITLLTMIAPSPDWIAMLANQKLTDINDNWQSISVDVYATDAGTDSGATYISGNADTNPRQNISTLEDTAPFSNQVIGTFKLTLLQVLSIRNDELQKTISVYPNPSNGKISIKILGTSVLELENAEIYAANGKRIKVYNNLNNQKEIELNSLASGLYFLKLNSDKGTITKKVVIQ